MARISSGSSTVATVVPATVQLEARANDASANPSTWLPESPMKTAAARPGLRLKGRNPTQASPSASESTRTVSLGCSVSASIAKYAQAIVASVAASPSMLSRRLKAFVIPTSQRSPMPHAEHVVLDDLDLQPARERDHRGPDLRGELDQRAQVAKVVEKTGYEEQRDADENRLRALRSTRRRRLRARARRRR